MTGVLQTPETIGQSVVLAVLFLFVGTAAGTIFCNHMSMEMKNTLEQWFAGIFAPAELSSVDYYSLFAGVLKKRFVWILVGDPDLPDVAVRDHLLCIGSLRIVSGGSDRLCPDDAQRIQRDPALFRAGLSTGDLLCTGGVSLVDRGPGTGAWE